MQRTEQQNIIVKAANSNTLNTIGVKAFAGTGKSTLLKEIVNEIDAKFLGFAFNNSIVKENDKKFDKKKCVWNTTHMLAEQLVKKHFKNKFDFSNRRGDFKIKELQNFFNLNKDSINLVKNTIEIYKLFCNSAFKSFSPEKIKEAAYHQGYINILHLKESRLQESIEYAEKIWNNQRKGILPISFDFYLKLAQFYDLSSSIKNIDFILLDEAQDSNAVTLDIIKKINGKKIYVGDDHQSIYSFRGTVNALSYVDESYYLSETFRYNKDIAKIANFTLFNYKKEEEKIVSNVNRSLDTRALLFRNNSAMISKMAEYVKNGQKFKTIKAPSDIFACSISLFEKKIGREISNDSYKYLDREFKSYKEIEEHIYETEDPELKSANTLLKMPDIDLFKILKKAKEFRKDKNIKVFFATAHTSKGLEFGHVELMKDFPNIKKLLIKYNFESIDQVLDEVKINNPLAKEIDQEINLLYVAQTRALSTLNMSELSYDLFDI